MTHFSLCSGIGGIDLAAERVGFESVAVCEIDPDCRKVLAARFPQAHQFKDIHDVNSESLRRFGIGRPTLISAGFPCQPFSVAGQRGGSDDSRHLWPQVARILCDVRPRWFVGENVRGLLSISNGRVFGAILRDLADMGYVVTWMCFGADEAALHSHRRDRVFIVGYLADSDIDRSQEQFWEQSRMGSRGDADGCREVVLAHSGSAPDRPSADARTEGRVCEKAGMEGCGAVEPERERDELGDTESRENIQRIPRSMGEEGQIGGCIDDAADTPSLHLEDSKCKRPGRRSRGLVNRTVPADQTAADQTARPSGELADALRDDRDGPHGEGGSRWGVRRTSYPLPVTPGPRDYDAWRYVLERRPDLAPALAPEEEVELEIRPVVDGISRRMALKMLGNAVDPEQVQPILDWIARYEMSENIQMAA